MKYLFLIIIFLTTSCFSVQSIQEYKNGVAIQYTGKDTDGKLDKIINMKCKNDTPYTWNESKFKYKTAYNVNGIIHNSNKEDNINATFSTDNIEGEYLFKTAMCHNPESILHLSEKTYLDKQSKICLDEKNSNNDLKYKACQECIAVLNNAYNNKYYDMNEYEKNIFLQSHIISCELNPFKCTDSRIFNKSISKSPTNFIEVEEPNQDIQKLKKELQSDDEGFKVVGLTGVLCIIAIILSL